MTEYENMQAALMAVIRRRSEKAASELSKLRQLASSTESVDTERRDALMKCAYRLQDHAVMLYGYTQQLQAICQLHQLEAVTQVCRQVRATAGLDPVEQEPAEPQREEDRAEWNTKTNVISMKGERHGDGNGQ